MEYLVLVNNTFVLYVIAHFRIHQLLICMSEYCTMAKNFLNVQSVTNHLRAELSRKIMKHEFIPMRNYLNVPSVLRNFLSHTV